MRPYRRSSPNRRCIRQDLKREPMARSGRRRWDIDWETWAPNLYDGFARRCGPTPAPSRGRDEKIVVCRRPPLRSRMPPPLARSSNSDLMGRLWRVGTAPPARRGRDERRARGRGSARMSRILVFAAHPTTRCRHGRHPRHARVVRQGGGEDRLRHGRKLEGVAVKRRRRGGRRRRRRRGPCRRAGCQRLCSS